MNPNARAQLVLVLLSAVSCTPVGGFRVMPGSPEYLLRSPDARTVPFADVLGQHTSLGSGWVELRPSMHLRIENAYYREGAPKKGLANFLGTEIARYSVQPSGAIRLLGTESKVAQRPPDQPPVQDLLAVKQARLRFHRYFYQIILNRRTGAHAAILLSAASARELESLAAAPDSACTRASPHCTIFPEACTVALEMQVIVNGEVRVIPWASTVVNLAPRPKTLSLMRLYRGKLRPVEINIADPEALRLPLVPGDQLTWQ